MHIAPFGTGPAISFNRVYFTQDGLNFSLRTCIQAWQHAPVMERLLSYAEARKNLAQQIIGRECTGNGTQVQLRLAEIFSEQVERGPGRTELRCGGCQLSLHAVQRTHMTFARHEHAFGRGRAPPPPPPRVRPGGGGGARARTGVPPAINPLWRAAAHPTTSPSCALWVGRPAPVLAEISTPSLIWLSTAGLALSDLFQTSMMAVVLGSF